MGRHQVGLLIAVVIGAALGFILGYFVETASAGADGGISFRYWLLYALRYQHFWWAIFGAAVAAGLVYVRRLTAP